MLDKKTFAIQSLRRASYRWGPRNRAMAAARVSRGEYTCANCKGVYKRKEVQLDHVLAVIDPVKGWTNFDDYIDRLLCDEAGWQVLCKPCHQTKSTKENKTRRLVKKKVSKKLTTKSKTGKLRKKGKRSVLKRSR